MHINTTTPFAGCPWCQIYTSGARSTIVTTIAMRKNSQRGNDEIRVTMGQAPQAMTTPITVSFE